MWGTVGEESGGRMSCGGGSARVGVWSMQAVGLRRASKQDGTGRHVSRGPQHPAVPGPTCGQRQEEVVDRWADMRSPHKDSKLWDRTSVGRVLSPCACECSGLGWQRWLPRGHGGGRTAGGWSRGAEPPLTGIFCVLRKAIAYRKVRLQVLNSVFSNGLLKSLEDRHQG